MLIISTGKDHLKSAYSFQTTDLNSALMNMLDWSQNKEADVLDNEIVNQLLIEKWSTYGKRCFTLRFLFSLFQLFLISLIIYMRPDVIFVQLDVCGSGGTTQEPEDSTAIVIVGALVYFFHYSLNQVHSNARNSILIY